MGLFNFLRRRRTPLEKDTFVTHAYQQTTAAAPPQQGGVPFRGNGPVSLGALQDHFASDAEAVASSKRPIFNASTTTRTSAWRNRAEIDDLLRPKSAPNPDAMSNSDLRPITPANNGVPSRYSYQPPATASPLKRHRGSLLMVPLNLKRLSRLSNESLTPGSKGTPKPSSASLYDTGVTTPSQTTTRPHSSNDHASRQQPPTGTTTTATAHAKTTEIAMTKSTMRASRSLRSLTRLRRTWSINSRGRKSSRVPDLAVDPLPSESATIITKNHDGVVEAKSSVAPLARATGRAKSLDAAVAGYSIPSQQASPVPVLPMLPNAASIGAKSKRRSRSAFVSGVAAATGDGSGGVRQSQIIPALMNELQATNIGGNRLSQHRMSTLLSLLRGPLEVEDAAAASAAAAAREDLFAPEPLRLSKRKPKQPLTISVSGEHELQHVQGPHHLSPHADSGKSTGSAVFPSGVYGKNSERVKVEVDLAPVHVHGLPVRDSRMVARVHTPGLEAVSLGAKAAEMYVGDEVAMLPRPLSGIPELPRHDDSSSTLAFRNSFHELGVRASPGGLSCGRVTQPRRPSNMPSPMSAVVVDPIAEAARKLEGLPVSEPQHSGSSHRATVAITGPEKHSFHHAAGDINDLMFDKTDSIVAATVAATAASTTTTALKHERLPLSREGSPRTQSGIQKEGQRAPQAMLSAAAQTKTATYEEPRSPADTSSPAYSTAEGAKGEEGEGGVEPLFRDIGYGKMQLPGLFASINQTGSPLPQRPMHAATDDGASSSCSRRYTWLGLDAPPAGGSHGSARSSPLLTLHVPAPAACESRCGSPRKRLITQSSLHGLSSLRHVSSIPEDIKRRPSTALSNKNHSRTHFHNLDHYYQRQQLQQSQYHHHQHQQQFSDNSDDDDDLSDEQPGSESTHRPPFDLANFLVPHHHRSQSSLAPSIPARRRPVAPASAVTNSRLQQMQRHSSLSSLSSLTSETDSDFSEDYSLRARFNQQQQHRPNSPASFATRSAGAGGDNPRQPRQLHAYVPTSPLTLTHSRSSEAANGPYIEGFDDRISNSKPLRMPVNKSSAALDIRRPTLPAHQVTFGADCDEDCDENDEDGVDGGGGVADVAVARPLSLRLYNMAATVRSRRSSVASHGGSCSLRATSPAAARVLETAPQRRTHTPVVIVGVDVNKNHDHDRDTHINHDIDADSVSSSSDSAAEPPMISRSRQPSISSPSLGDLLQHDDLILGFPLPSRATKAVGGCVRKGSGGGICGGVGGLGVPTGSTRSLDVPKWHTSLSAMQEEDTIAVGPTSRSCAQNVCWNSEGRLRRSSFRPLSEVGET